MEKIVKNNKTKIDADNTILSLVVEMGKIKKKIAYLISVIEKLDRQINSYE